MNSTVDSLPSFSSWGNQREDGCRPTCVPVGVGQGVPKRVRTRDSEKGSSVLGTEGRASTPTGRWWHLRHLISFGRTSPSSVVYTPLRPCFLFSLSHVPNQKFWEGRGPNTRTSVRRKERKHTSVISRTKTVFARRNPNKENDRWFNEHELWEVSSMYRHIWGVSRRPLTGGGCGRGRLGRKCRCVRKCVVRGVQSIGHVVLSTSV